MAPILKKAVNLSILVLTALLVGIGFGGAVHELRPDWVYPLDRYLLAPLGQVFLRLIQFVVVPIVFCSLLAGLTRIKSASQVGRYLLKLCLGYLSSSGVGIALGLALVLWLHPGAGMAALPSETAVVAVAQSPNLLDWLIGLIPVNPLQALSENNLLQVIVCGALVAVGIHKSGEKAAPLVALVESIYALSENVLALVLCLAPLGVFGLIGSVMANQGIGILGQLFRYMAVVVLAIGAMFGFYLLVLAAIGRSPLAFLRQFFPSLALAFATASSNAALPVALDDAAGFAVSPEIANFAIPLGTALKRDGMAVGQVVNALFVAQLYHVAIDGRLLFSVALSTLLVSFSTAGVPGAGIVMMTTIFGAAGLPLEGVALLAGVDRLMDSFHTVLNLQGNLVNAIFLDWWESRPSFSAVAEHLEA
ncbi:MAG: dicarboxylate/amino acid:cation symporter [Pseudanabaenaceae cyanobacterium]